MTKLPILKTNPIIVGISLESQITFPKIINTRHCADYINEYTSI